MPGTAKQVTGIAEPLRQAFDRYDWPGNVRELRNMIESAVVQDLDGTLDLDDLPESDPLRQLDQANADLRRESDGLVGRPLAEVERYLHRAGLGTDRRQPRGGGQQLLGIGERTLYRVIQDWKQQDKIRAALDAAGWDFETAGGAWASSRRRWSGR